MLVATPGRLVDMMERGRVVVDSVRLVVDGLDGGGEELVRLQ